MLELQPVLLEDVPTIHLNDRGWKPLNQLSVGQKCTALLSIAMLERETPLILDQPEDSLDNAFIFQNVVQITRKLKDKRQLIIATHNANIPVLGDSELMLVMKSNGSNGFVTTLGVIDDANIKTHAQNILEGGEKAFKWRLEKYGF